ncbi:MAG: hypothetical protein CM15mP112_04490 [Flavobacteriales bacterium]|nr:MAG: hypothetical protein CM15mP112_04490 [Flavobacteriales bacterium]
MEILLLNLKKIYIPILFSIVDEASMISEASDSGFGNRSLLQDLIKYVYEGIDCKLILIGDKAQLPPVNLDISPALNEEILFLNYNKQVISKELTEVVRQKKDSLILENATRIRKKSQLMTIPIQNF